MLKEILNNLVDNVKSKIQKINIANYNNSDIIGLKRIKCDKRCYIYYKDFIELSERYKNLVELINNTHKNGIIIVLLNNDIFDIINNPNEINRYIFNKIGSNEIISSIILIKNVDSGKATKEINNLIEDFNIIKEEYKYIPIRKLSENNCGNDKWMGHLLVCKKLIILYILYFLKPFIFATNIFIICNISFINSSSGSIFLF